MNPWAFRAGGGGLGPEDRIPQHRPCAVQELLGAVGLQNGQHRAVEECPRTRGAPGERQGSAREPHRAHADSPGGPPRGVGCNPIPSKKEMKIRKTQWRPVWQVLCLLWRKIICYINNELDVCQRGISSWNGWHSSCVIPGHRGRQFPETPGQICSRFLLLPTLDGMSSRGLANSI